MRKKSHIREHFREWRLTCEGLERALRAFPNVSKTESCEKCGCPVMVHRLRRENGEKIKWYKCADPECSFVKTIGEQG